MIRSEQRKFILVVPIPLQKVHLIGVQQPSPLVGIGKKFQGQRTTRERLHYKHHHYVNRDQIQLVCLLYQHHIDVRQIMGTLETQVVAQEE